MTSVWNILWLAAFAFAAAVLLAVPLAGILYGAAGAMAGAFIIGSLILIQWPMFVLLRAYLPKKRES